MAATLSWSVIIPRARALCFAAAKSLSTSLPLAIHPTHTLHRVRRSCLLRQISNLIFQNGAFSECRYGKVDCGAVSVRPWANVVFSGCAFNKNSAFRKPSWVWKLCERNSTLFQCVMCVHTRWRCHLGSERRQPDAADR